MIDSEWNDLLAAVEARQVIPIIGDGIVDAPIGLGGGRLSHWLAAELAKNLGLTDFSEPVTLNRVVSTYLIGGGRRQVVYTRLKQILDSAEPQLSPPRALLDLAAVRDCTLFVSTTFDSLLADALNQERHGGQPKTTVAAYRPGAHGQEKDTPMRKAKLPPDSTMIAQLLGRATTKPDYAVWDEDILEFVLALHADLSYDQMPNLAYDLQDNHLLFVGLGFSDWLTRFFVRVAQQHRLSESSETSCFLAVDGPPIEESLVLFFNSAQQETRVWPCRPVEFCSELRQRWEQRNGARQSSASRDSFRWPEKTMPTGSVFISYAREDLEAVKSIKSGLEAAGCSVWFDIERLQAGENWRNSLEDEVRSRCGIFLSVISEKTERDPGYYHLERTWAEQTAHRHGASGEFYIPVIIDDTRASTLRRETRLRMNANIVRLPGGIVTPEFASRMSELQSQIRPES